MFANERFTWIFACGFLGGLVFFVMMEGQHQGNDNFSLYSLFLICPALGCVSLADFGLNSYI